MPEKMKSRRTKLEGFNPELIAPCGIECRVCRAYLRERDSCPGCRHDNEGKPKTRAQCQIKLCDHRPKKALSFCFECNLFPCQRLEALDNRYRTRYHLSVIDNLEAIKSDGIRAFVREEPERWLCAECGSILCVHRRECPSCGTQRPIKELV